MNARTQALAAQDQAIQNNVAHIEKQKSRSALESMAARLSITVSKLQSTLLATVFKGAKEEEFAALIVVANELGLNPLKKEIYAFPSRGGITPMISYDGWISITNRHPQYDGSEENDIFHDGKFIGVETVIYRKDRSHPVKKTIFHDEFKMNTDPWKQKPRHMTAMRSFCHAARLAFGVSGVLVEDDIVTIDMDTSPQIMPTSRQLKQRQQETQPDVGYDADTGEISAEDDAAIEREAARMTGQAGDGDTFGDDEYDDSEARIFDEIVRQLQSRSTVPDINSLMVSDNMRAVLETATPDMASKIEAAKQARIAEIKGN